MNFGRSDWIALSLMDIVKKFPNVNEAKIESSCIAFSNALSNMVITMENVNSTYNSSWEPLFRNIVGANSKNKCIYKEFQRR